MKLALGLGLVGLLGWRYRGELAELAERGVRMPWVVAAILVLLANMLVTFYRWAIMARALGLHFSFRQAMRLGFLGYISSLVLPSSLGGDVVRSILVARHQERRAVAVASVWVDRLVGLLGLAWLASIAGIVAISMGMNELVGLGWWVVGTSVVLTTGFVLVLWLPSLGRGRLVVRLARVPGIGGPVSEVLAAIRAYRDRWTVVLGATGLSVVGHGLFLSAAWIGGLAVWEEPPRFLAHVLATPIALLFSVLPLTPGGLGIAELAVSGLFELVGEDPGAALLMMLVNRGSQIAILGTAALALSLDLRRLSAGAAGGTRLD